MLSITETLTVARSQHDCFCYLADLRKLVEWDPLVREARKDTPGPVGKGSCFTIKINIVGMSVPFRYVITEFTPDRRIVYSGRSAFINVNDTIDIVSGDEGCQHITYRADFFLKWGLERLIGNFAKTTRTQYNAAISGLYSALSSMPSEATIHPKNVKADAQTISALRCFTRHGYLSGRRTWAPMSYRLEGRHVVLTGANSGIGLAAAIELAAAGADLTLVVRTQEKAAATLQTIELETGRNDIRFELADLSLLCDTEALSQRLLQGGKPIDVLINNAGALFNQHQLTREGLEQSYALLLLSPVLLTERLLPLLEAHELPARIVNVVSGGMYAERLNLKRLNLSADGYRGARAYAQCKRALSIMTEIWADRWRERNIVVNAMHPGWSDTPGVQKALPMFRRVTRLVLRSHAEGADTIVWLAQSPQGGLSTGKLFLDREPRSTYLLGNNVEAVADRAALETQLNRDIDKTLPT